MEDQTALEVAEQEAAPSDPNVVQPTSSFAKPPGEDEDMAKALQAFKAFKTAMGRKDEEPAAVPAPAVEPAVEAPKASEPVKVDAPPAVDVSKYEREVAELRAQLKAKEDLALKAKLNPIEFLKESGLTLEQVTDWLQNGDQSKTKAELEKSALEKQLAEYKAREQAEAQQREQAAAQTRQEQARQQYLNEVIKPAVSAKDYPLLHAVHGAEAHQLLLNFAIAEYQRTGVEAPVAKLAAQVEKQLSDLQSKLGVRKQEPAVAPSLKSLQSATQVPTGAKHDDADDEAAMQAALAKLTQIRQSKGN